MKTKTFYGEDRQGNPSAATIVVVEEDKAAPMGQTFEPYKLEIRGQTYQNLPGRKYLVRVYSDGREVRVNV